MLLVDAGLALVGSQSYPTVHCEPVQPEAARLPSQPLAKPTGVVARSLSQTSARLFAAFVVCVRGSSATVEMRPMRRLGTSPEKGMEDFVTVTLIW